MKLAACLLAAAAAGGGMASPATALSHAPHAASSCAVERRLPPVHKQLCAVNHASKFMMCSSPKAAATTLSAVMVGFANATEQFRTWMREHEYGVSSMLSARINYFRRSLGGLPAYVVPDDLLATCAQKDWLCVFLVRNPRDRLISSFLHAAVTKLASNWPELIEIVGDVELVRVGNYSLAQHVEALELTRANIRGGLSLRGNGRRGGGADHYLPQYGAWLDGLFRASGSPRYPASVVKFAAVDNVAGSLNAVDEEFRGGALRLRAIAEGLHSSHWRSAPKAAAMAHRRTTRVLAAAPRRRLGERALATGAARPARAYRQGGDAGEINTDTFASTLCGSAEGLTPRGMKKPRAADGTLLKGKQSSTSGCDLLPRAYMRLQAVDDGLWRHVRCLFHDDFELYEKRLCDQEWLRARCPACIARAAC